jgi:hypothetical protein
MVIALVRTAAYGQLLRIVEFVADLPVITNDKGEITQKPQTVLLAVVCPVKEIAKSQDRVPLTTKTASSCQSKLLTSMI